MGLEPCPLCMFQRVAVIAIGIVFLVARVHNPRRVGAAFYAVLDADLRGRRRGLRRCARSGCRRCRRTRCPRAAWGSTTCWTRCRFTDVLSKVLEGSGECAEKGWVFLGLPIPGWTFVFFVAMIVARVRADPPRLTRPRCDVYFGAIRIAPSRRITSPFSIGLRTISRTSDANSARPSEPRRKRHHLAERFLRLGRKLRHHRRLEDARRDRHHANAVARELARDRQRHADDARLRRAVGRLADLAVERRDRRRVDDHAALAVGVRRALAPSRRPRGASG